MQRSNKVLVHGTHAYFPTSFLQAPQQFIFTTAAEEVVRWEGPLIVLGGWQIELGRHLQERPSSKKLIYCVVDAANTIQTLKAMHTLGLAERFIQALIKDDRREIVRCFYDAIRPDIFVVNNPFMADEFRKACPDTPTMICHPCGNSQLRFNIFDAFIEADQRVKHVQNGGLPKYIIPELQEKLEQLDRNGLIKLLPPNIEGGYIYENLLIPPEPQIVISCRKSRKAVMGSIEIDYTPIERDWKPATKYANSIYSGSDYIGTFEQSLAYLASEDKSVQIVDSHENALSSLGRATQKPCEQRRLEAFSRLRETEMSSTVDARNYVRTIYSLCW